MAASVEIEGVCYAMPNSRKRGPRLYIVPIKESTFPESAYLTISTTPWITIFTIVAGEPTPDPRFKKTLGYQLVDPNTLLGPPGRLPENFCVMSNPKVTLTDSHMPPITITHSRRNPSKKTYISENH